MSKEVVYFEQAKKDLKKFPRTARTRMAGLLDMVKEGLELAPKDFKYMPSVGKGVYELRVRLSTQYRVFYVSKFDDAIYVLHAFSKKTQKTSKKDIELGVKRYKELLEELRRKI